MATLRKMFGTILQDHDKISQGFSRFYKILVRSCMIFCKLPNRDGQFFVSERAASSAIKTSKTSENCWTQRVDA